MKKIRALLTVFLTCLIALNIFISPAFASPGSAIESFGNGFWQTLGSIFGGAVGTVAVCYTVDAIIAPFAPPIAATLAPMCPAIGGTIGGIGGLVTVNAVGG